MIKLRLVTKQRIAKIEERFRDGPVRKNAEGKWEVERTSTGWWVDLAPGHISYHVGAERPRFEEGQEVDLVIEGEERAR